MIKATQRGFTLIELVVVIVILGILAAFAVPRFMNLEGEARAATIKSLGGSLMSAASMARAKCQAQGCGNAGTITVENGLPVTMAFGYPNRNTVGNALQSVEGFAAANNGAGRRFTKLGGPNTCWVQYNPPTAVNTSPTLTYGGTAAVPGTPQFNQELATACQ